MIKEKLTSVAIIGGTFLASALAVGAFYARPIFDSLTGDLDWDFPVATAFAMFFILWSLSGLGAGTLGLIWHLAATKRGWTNAFVYVGAGLLMGAAIPAVLSAPMWVPQLNYHAGEALGFGFGMGLTAVGAIMGTLSALFAWLIRRPDRDAANLATATP
ncbi:MAG: hypothetical protein ABL871_06570 [Terricaulis sp.]